MLGYSSSSVYCFSTYEMDNGLYIKPSIKGRLWSKIVIVVGTLIAPSNTYYDVVLSNNENLAEIDYKSNK